MVYVSGVLGIFEIFVGIYLEYYGEGIIFDL